MLPDSDIRFTRNLFLRCISVIFLFAFTSLYIQIPGLYGDNGILPARTQLSDSSTDYVAKMQQKPTLLWFAPYLGLNTEYMMDVLALCGMFLAFSGFISQRFCVKPTFAGLWSLYYSLYQVGQTFMWFQWDILLLETGFLCILIAPFWQGKVQRNKKGAAATQSGSTDSVKMWLVRWLLFRLMFSSAVVKLTSGCPSWWGLTALKIHFESMCIPSPLAWYSHHLPAWFLKVNTAAAIVAELALPLLFFLPIKPVRFLAFLIQAFFQIAIILTGNFNFFNYLTFALCLSLVDDSFFGGQKKDWPSKLLIEQKKTSWFAKVISYLVTLLIYGGIVYATVIFFGFKLQPGGVIESKITFTNKQFDKVLGKALPLICIYGASSLTMTSFKALSSAMSQKSTPLRNFMSTISTMFYISMAAFIFADSLVPLSSLHPNGNATVPASIKEWHSKLSHLHLTNSYGLFRRITGVGGRPEVIIEGSNSMEGPWQEYNFLYKPGNVNTSLPFVAPHQPRLDWQMWFAALGTYHQNPWIMSLTYRLLTGQKEVLKLIDQNNLPFKKSPPKFIRASLYHYHYTPWSRKDATATWTRHRVDEYFPIFSKDHQPLLEYLQKLNILNESKKKEKLSSSVVDTLEFLRKTYGDFDPAILMLSLFTAGLAAIFISRFIPSSSPAQQRQQPPTEKLEKRRKK